MGCGCNKKIKTPSITVNKTTNKAKKQNENKILLGGDGISNWNKNKVRKKRKKREEGLKNEIKRVYGFEIDIQKEKELHSEFKLIEGNSSAPVEGDTNFPAWLRLKYRKIKDKTKNNGNDDLTIIYS